MYEHHVYGHCEQLNAVIMVYTSVTFTMIFNCNVSIQGMYEHHVSGWCSSLR